MQHCQNYDFSILSFLFRRQNSSPIQDSIIQLERSRLFAQFAGYNNKRAVVQTILKTKARVTIMDGIATGETREFLYKDLVIDPNHPGLTRVKRRLKTPVKTEQASGNEAPTGQALPVNKKKRTSTLEHQLEEVMDAASIVGDTSAELFGPESELVA